MQRHTENINYGVYETTHGQFTIVCNDLAVVGIHFGNQLPDGCKDNKAELMDRTASELAEYFDGKRKHFDIPFALHGTPFQKAVWDALCHIPYGETRSYKEIAAAVGNPKASRAVGMANNKNPIPLLVPCHRVIGASGLLVGYAGGLDLKKKLLKLENEAL